MPVVAHLCLCYPKAWKKANVIPIHKKDSKQCKENYRPISLLSCVGKVMEIIIFNELYEYCTENNLLTWRNSGFKRNDSTTNQLLYIVHQLYTSLDNGNDVLMIFLDISKAFDRVYHQGLLYKLETFGISENLYNWMKSYLEDRSQRVVLSGCASEWRSTNAGVPQGSILGPLLFLIFINDIVDGIDSEAFLFADDTSLYRQLRHESDVASLNSDLEKINNWAAQWLVDFNVKKT